MRSFFLFLFLFISPFQNSGLLGQDLKTELLPEEKKTKAWKVYLAPTVLTSASLLTFWDLGAFYRKDVQASIQNSILSDFETRYDDYLQFAPLVAVAGFKVAGWKGKNDGINTALLFLKSEILMFGLVHALKRTTKVWRPDGSSQTAYPSGHTAQAFLSASILHKEYGQKHPWLSVLGYAGAASTAYFRMLNNRHWISDVLFGAAIGIASVELIYATHQYRWGKSSNWALVPQVSPRFRGLYFAASF